MDIDNHANITASVFLEKMIDGINNHNLIIIDIRTTDEYNVYHLQNAINIDFYAETFADKLDALDKNKTYLIYCRTGKRTGTDENNALALMQKLGFTDVYNMLGGIHDFVKVPNANNFIK